MATINLLVGQCGNQLGTQYLEAIAQEAMESDSFDYQTMVSNQFFRPARVAPSRRPRRARKAHQTLPETTVDTRLPQPRCVMVDMEPKVIEQRIAQNNTTTATHTPLYHLDPQQCVMRGSGSGNNWAYGYLCIGEESRTSIEECLRREAEESDTAVTTFHTMHSVAGGTGSGVGCVVAEVVKDLFPSSVLHHTVVWPFDSGEVATQWYNIVLSLSTLRDVVDSALLTFNDEVASQLQGKWANRGLPDKASVDFKSMNEFISRQLTSLFLPQRLYHMPSPRLLSKGAFQNPSGPSPPSAMRYSTSEDIVEALALDPGKKFFVSRTIPKLNTGTTTWAAVLEEASRAARGLSSPSFFHPVDDRALYGWNSPGSCLWTIRGYQGGSLGVPELQHLMALHRSQPFPLSSLMVSPIDDAAPFPGCGDHLVHLYGPSPSIADRLSHAVDRAETLLQVGAYVHHFSRYGVEKHEMMDHLARVCDTAQMYR